MRYQKISIPKVAEVLDLLAIGKTFEQAGLEAKISSSSVYKIAQDFPLWKYFREHPNEG